MGDSTCSMIMVSLLIILIAAFVVGCYMADRILEDDEWLTKGDSNEEHF